MIVQKNRTNLFKNRINMFFNITNYKNWLKKTFIRIIVVSILLVTILTIKVLNFERPKKTLSFVESKLEFDENIQFYVLQAKKVSNHISTLRNKAITAMKIEDKLHRNFIPPIDGEITTYFDENIGETSNTSKGLVFTSDVGENIFAIDEGIVIDIGSNKSIGNYIIIKHKGELLSVYKYVGTSYVDINQIVNQGQIIGNSSEKLLLEVWYRNEPVDPMEHINTNTQ